MKRLNRKITGIFIAGILLVLLALLMDQTFMPYFSGYYVEWRMERAQKEINQKEQDAEQLLAELIASPQGPSFERQAALIKKSASDKIYLYVFENGGLIFWTSNTVFPDKIIQDTNSFVQELGNGMYLQRNIMQGSRLYISLIPVQYDYAFENQYLQDNLAFSNTDDLEYSFHFDPNKGFKFLSVKGIYLFSIEASLRGTHQYWIALMYLAGLFLCVLVIHGQLKHFIRRQRWLKAVLLFGGFILFIVVSWQLHYPEQLYTTAAFRADHYASSMVIASLGDLLIFSLLAFYCSWFLLRLPQARLWKKTLPSPIRLPILSLAVILFGTLIVLITKSLVLDSQVSFDLSNIYSLSLYSFVGLFIICGWLGCFLAFTEKLGFAMSKSYKSNRQFGNVISLVFVTAACMLALMQLGFWVYLVYSVISIAGFYIYHRRKNQSRGGMAVIMLIISATFMSIVLSRYNGESEWNRQQLTAENLAKERDPVAEYLFQDLYLELQNDIYLKSYYLNPILSDVFLKKRIRQLYFSGYFSKYDIEILTFTPNGMPFNSQNEHNLQYYQSLLDRQATQIKGDKLYFLHHFTGLPTYIALIPVYRQNDVTGHLLVEFQQKAFYEESVYPELLLSEDVQRLREIGNFSYALYSNGILLNQRGEYSYPARLNRSLFDASENIGMYQTRGFTHLVHRETSSLYIIVSAKKKSLLYYMSIFAFLLFFFTLSLLIFVVFAYASTLLRKPFKSLLRSVFKENMIWKRLSFRYKILATVITGMSIALLLIGFATVQYISYQYNRDELEKIRQQTREIALRLSSELQNYDPESPVEEDELSRLIKSLSDVYQADVNMYDAAGNLISTTQNLIYERRIIEPKMDALAFLKFNVLYASQVVQEEQIGRLQYTSAYTPLRNSAGIIIGYVNHPYFTKEAELRDRISSFLVALINLYLLLFLLLLALGIFMTRALTAPLDIIRNHLRNTSLRGSNELIHWNTNDEIGKLVKEYNTMILALKESVERLAQSEREGAWREMAKQVAHEIKNPLTPMKLNIQRLQRAYQEDDPNKGPLFEKVTNLLIRQIDSLSQIATAFSAFAKMPQGEPKEVDLKSLLHDEAELFGQNEAVHIALNLPDHELKVYADPNQLNQVFNNIIKNGIQAIPEEREKHIRISAIRSGKFAMIDITDNGGGIPAELLDKIFLPNFSTKTSGMGLGLAIVRNIIEKSGGGITFTTRIGEGTTFHIRLPVSAASAKQEELSKSQD